MLLLLYTVHAKSLSEQNIKLLELDGQLILLDLRINGLITVINSSYIVWRHCILFLLIFIPTVYFLTALSSYSAFQGCKCSNKISCQLSNTHTHTHTHTHGGPIALPRPLNWSIKTENFKTIYTKAGLELE